MRRFFSLLVFIGLLATCVYAQTETGTITGTVLDASGAVVPNANVEAKNVATGVARTTTTSTAGLYVVPNLAPGDYEVTVSASGFQTMKQRLAVEVGARIGLDFKVTVGSTSTTIEVAASAVAVNTESQTLGSTIGVQQVMELPSVNRDPYAFVATVPNISPSDPDGRGVGYAINGMRSASTNIMLDGVANNDEFSATRGQNIPMDSVQEYSVLTSDFTAEYGRASAAWSTW